MLKIKYQNELKILHSLKSLTVPLKKKTTTNPEPNDKVCGFYNEDIFNHFNMKINLLKSGYFYKFAWIITELVNIILSLHYYIITNKSVLYFEHVSEALFFFTIFLT